MKSIILRISFALLPFTAMSFVDDNHYSKIFDEIRFFRVFTPPDYNPADTTKKYPVIYYFHGCGGSYESSGSRKYSDWGLTHPVAVNRPYNEAYEYPNNADFENYTYNNNIIIISVDGKIKGLGGCGVYYPSLADSLMNNYYNFSAYIRELISIVDERYNTKTGPQYRAISGLSMGGHMAIWLAAANPHLFSSASEFCHSPSYFDVGKPSYMTTIDVKELWRNLRGVPFRHSTNEGDYLKYYTKELYFIYSGAGFQNKYYLTDFCRHWAARVDLQFDFHRKHFESNMKKIKCFSFINLYPNFEVWDFNISSSKIGNGWIYLRDVTKNGLGIYTRKRLPWGNGLPTFNIDVITPAIYIPHEAYTLSRYSYRNNTFSIEKIKSDSLGRLKLTSSGGIGEEIGILGKNLQPPVILLTDTINENIYLEDNTEKSLSFDVINLSSMPQTINFIAETENNDILTILKGKKQITIPPQSKKRVDSFIVCKGKYLSSFNNTGYIKITSSIDGVIQDREHVIQVNVIQFQPEHPEVKIFDGKSETISLFKYGWNNWRHPVTVSSGSIKEGIGNANGKPEMGEIFSIWIKPSSALDSTDINTWHPTIPINNKNNPDISVVKIEQHAFSTGGAVLSAQIRLNRPPTKRNPVKIPLRSKFLKVEPLANDCHRSTADNFGYFYYEIIINSDFTANVLKMLK